MTVNITAPENLHNTGNVHNRVLSGGFSINSAYFWLNACCFIVDSC